MDKDKDFFYDFVLYTDGSCSSNGHANNRGGWGCVIKHNDNSITTFSGKTKNTTNNRMEITAAIEGLARCPNNSLVKVVTDSQYVVGTMTKNWRKNKNTDLWNKLLVEVSRMKKVTFEWVKGHNGHEFNELADSLADVSSL
jgi:ribonuclease HI